RPWSRWSSRTAPGPQGRDAYVWLLGEQRAQRAGELAHQRGVREVRRGEAFGREDRSGLPHCACAPVGGGVGGAGLYRHRWVLSWLRDRVRARQVFEAPWRAVFVTAVMPPGIRARRRPAQQQGDAGQQGTEK